MNYVIKHNGKNYVVYKGQQTYLPCLQDIDNVLARLTFADDILTVELLDPPNNIDLFAVSYVGACSSKSTLGFKRRRGHREILYSFKAQVGEILEIPVSEIDYPRSLVRLENHVDDSWDTYSFLVKLIAYKEEPNKSNPDEPVYLPINMTSNIVRINK